MFFSKTFLVCISPHILPRISQANRDLCQTDCINITISVKSPCERLETRLPPWDTVLVLWPRRRSIFRTLTRFLRAFPPFRFYE